MQLCPSGVAIPCLLGLLAAPAAADVLVVDGLGGDHAQISSAVAAASSGDTILVKSGEYISFTIDGKSLVVTRALGASVAVNGSITVQNLPAGRSVVLRGLDVRTTAGVAQGIAILDCAGSVAVQDSTFDEPYLPQSPVAGGTVSSSADVSFVRCTLRGSRGSGSRDGGLGLACTDSTVALFDSSASGGSGGAQLFGMFGLPGDGLRVDGGSLFASGCTLRGGRGWDGTIPFGCTNAGQGAPALRLRGSAPEAWLRSTTLLGGEAGTPAPPCLPAARGPAQIIESGSATVDPRPARSLHVESPLHPGETLVATFQGEPGDRVHVLVALAARAPAAPGGALGMLGGAALPASGVGGLFPAAELDASGSLVLTAAVPASLPLASGALSIELEALMIPALPPHGPVRSGPEHVTFLHPSL